MARGEGVVGAWVNLFAPDLVECCGYLGFDFVFLDGEHGLIGPAECLDLVRAADVASLVSFVRVPRNDPSTILGYLETGALGIVVPHVRTALEAQEAVAAVKYPPHGHRSAMYASRSGAYGMTLSPSEYYQAANEQTMVVALVEEQEGVRNLEPIAAVTGIDLVFLGDGDLSMDLGYPGRRQHPVVQEVVMDALRRARERNIRLGMCAYTPAEAESLIAAGVCWVMTVATSLFAAAGRAYVTAVRAAAGRA